jgi:hypothetical protein
MYEAPAREGQVSVVVAIQTCRAVWACIDPTLCQTASLDVLPQAHEGMTLRIIGPTGLSWGLSSFQWTRGYPSPTSPRSLDWFWNNQPKDLRSSLQFFDFDKECLENKSAWPLLLNSEWPGKNDLLLSSSAIYSLKFSVLSRFYALEVSILLF